MTEQERINVKFVREYLAALSRQAVGEELGRFFHENVEQIEYPNLLNPEGAHRDKAALLVGAENGRRATEDHRYELRSIVVNGHKVAAEVEWSCTLKVPLGKLGRGDSVRAALSMFMELEDGKIRSLRNYDCFYPSF